MDDDTDVAALAEELLGAHAAKDVEALRQLIADHPDYLYIAEEPGTVQMLACDKTTVIASLSLASMGGLAAVDR